jgi:chromosome segregation ATPase
MGMLLNNETVNSKLGQPLNVVDLLHTTTVNSLNSIRLSLAKQIESLENADEWVATDASQIQLNKLKTAKETVNLVIGYKRFKQELAEIRTKRHELEDKIAKMKEEAKTPEDRLKEAEEELAALDNPNI